MDFVLLSVLAGSAMAAPTPDSYSQVPAVPMSYSYGGYPRVQAEIQLGTPGGKVVPTIFDTGSVSYWTYGPNATINDGSMYHFTQGPCNKSVTTFYDWPKSSTHTELITIPRGYSYSYGGNGKIIDAPWTINDTLAFSNKNWPAIPNTQVALANFTVVTQGDENCAIAEDSFDHSILGLAPIVDPNYDTPPSFRNNLRSQGLIESSSFSMWFDKPSSDAKGTFQGTTIFGAVPDKSKYSGELVRVTETPPEGRYVGYYVPLPSLTATNFEKPGEAQTIKVIDDTVKQCLLDSGTGEVRVPFSQEQLINVTGLVQLQSPYIAAYDGPCESIPESAALNFTFPGATAGKSVTISVPVRNFARGEYDAIPGFDTSKYCGLSFSADEYGDCVFGAPFSPAAFMVFNDDKKQIALAQGGVSTGSDLGPSGLGTVTKIAAGDDIPCSV